jgi:hypothetical protein
MLSNHATDVPPSPKTYSLRRNFDPFRLGTVRALLTKRCNAGGGGHRRKTKRLVGCSTAGLETSPPFAKIEPPQASTALPTASHRRQMPSRVPPAVGRTTSIIGHESKTRAKAPLARADRERLARGPRLRPQLTSFNGAPGSTFITDATGPPQVRHTWRKSGAKTELWGGNRQIAADQVPRFS